MFMQLMFFFFPPLELVSIVTSQLFHTDTATGPGMERIQISLYLTPTASPDVFQMGFIADLPKCFLLFFHTKKKKKRLPFLFQGYLSQTNQSEAKQIISSVYLFGRFVSQCKFF